MKCPTSLELEQAREGVRAKPFDMIPKIRLIDALERSLAAHRAVTRDARTLMVLLRDRVTSEKVPGGIRIVCSGDHEQNLADFLAAILADLEQSLKGVPNA